MGPPSQGPPGETYRKSTRRRHVHRRRPKFRLLFVLVAAAVLLIPASLIWRRIPVSRPSEPPPQARSKDRQALVAAVNKEVAGIGKDLPPSDIVVTSASVKIRDGNLVLWGAVKNRTERAYPLVHIIFDSLDRRHNTAGVVEGDVRGLQPNKETAFEIGPVNPQARTFLVRSIRPVQ
jgi:hypothetical protein